MGLVAGLANNPTAIRRQNRLNDLANRLTTASVAFACHTGIADLFLAATSVSPTGLSRTRERQQCKQTSSSNKNFHLKASLETKKRQPLWRYVHNFNRSNKSCQPCLEVDRLAKLTQ